LPKLDGGDVPLSVLEDDGSSAAILTKLGDIRNKVQ
jgi:hypothetical protein